jgi:hypothetical protein
LAIDRNEEKSLSKLDAQFGTLLRAPDFVEGRKEEAEGRTPVCQGM